MVLFPGLRKRTKANGPLELVSIHIPKTAGTSFQHALEFQYGANRVARIDFPEHAAAIRPPEGVTVIHGHITMEEARILDDSQSIPRITWLRHPVDRVISNYNYLSGRLDDLLDEPRHGVDILSKMKRTLLEYAAADRNRNRIAHFMAGHQPEDFSFIGLVEQYAIDLGALRQHFGWKAASPVHHNSSSKSAAVDPVIRATIEELNAEDMRWYAEVLRFKGVER